MVVGHQWDNDFLGFLHTYFGYGHDLTCMLATLRSCQQHYQIGNINQDWYRSQINLYILCTGSKRGRYSYKRKYDYADKIASAEEKNENIVQTIPPQPGTVSDEVLKLATDISRVFLSCHVNPPNYYEKIHSSPESSAV